MSTKKVQFAAKMPETVVDELRTFCKGRNLVMASFVADTVHERIQRIKEDEEDLATIEAREHEKSISESEMDKYLRTLPGARI